MAGRVLRSARFGWLESVYGDLSMGELRSARLPPKPSCQLGQG